MTISSGLLLLDKPKGLTSHDVVAKVRHIIHEKRVGHAGTLDPMATGLLVLAVGPSTRLLRFAQSEVKRYTGAVRLGVATNSLDADGTVTLELPVPLLSAAQMTNAGAAMVGAQWQTPPMVSAKKISGRRLHQLARQGVEIDREPRPITVSEFTMSATNNPAVWNFDVECTVGTYVRVLLSDLAEHVGTVGHLVELRRLASGVHHVDQALTLDEFALRAAGADFALRAPRSFVEHLESVVLSADEERQMRMGQQLDLTATFMSDEIAAIDRSEDLIGILRRRVEKWQPELVLPLSTTSASE
jgi:tRNA pseudouridine55 synthase